MMIFVIFVVISCHSGVEATGTLKEDFASDNHHHTYSKIYEKAKYTMKYWLQKLPSGPSPSGPEMKINTLLIIFVISVAILSHTTAVEASRLYMLCEGFGNVNKLERSSSVYEKAKNSMACLLERLPSGPSPGGIGH
uniref:Uncharacterized protein n=1 Tax=Quercus lobata TaxID=97700 RepID=A0A7N2MVD4_QUELO